MAKKSLLEAWVQEMHIGKMLFDSTIIDESPFHFSYKNPGEVGRDR
jgi:hypothetical protein